MTLKIDKEFQSLIPPLSSEERELLEANIVADGCRDPIVVWQGTVIDGHNRHEICTRLDLHYETVERSFIDRTEIILWMIKNQMGRRNLEDIDRIGLQGRKEELLKPIADVSRKAGNSLGGKGKSSAKLPTTSKVDTRKECAKSAGVGERTYDAGKMILEAVKRGEIDQSEVEAIRRKEKSISGVAKKIKEKKQQGIQQAKQDAVEPQQGESAAVSIVKDVLGRDVPLHLREAHRRALELMSLGRQLDKIKAEAIRLTMVPGDPSGHAQEVEISCKAFKRLIQQPRYWTACPRCDGVGCDRCRGNGFFDYTQRSSLSHADKQTLGVK